METVFTKMLRRLHRRNILPGLVRAVYRCCSNRRVLELSADRAWETVHGITPRPRGSAYWEMPENPEGGYDVSVIIPFYNTEAYAVECIESVLSQVCDCRVETILVDDGSPDRCGEILDSYADRENVVVIHQKNQGVSAARNHGIAAARGEYLMFVDSDDYLAEGAIQALMTAARKHDADVVEGSNQTVTSEGKFIQDFRKKAAVSTQGANMFGYPCGKVLRKALFRNICFPEGFHYEDCIIVNLILPQARTTVTIEELVFYYRQNPKGASSTTAGNPKAAHGVYLSEVMLDAYRKLGLECSGPRQRQLILELGPWLLYRVQWMTEEQVQALFIAACDIMQRNELLPGGPSGRYFYDEIVEAFRHRQYDRWKWASMLY